MGKPSPEASPADFGPLGKVVPCPDAYDRSLLTPIPRSRGRQLLHLREHEPLPFVGVDVWTMYEASWLNAAGKPRRLILEMRVPATTPFLVESKSLKLYLNSLNFVRFSSDEDAMSTIRSDVGLVLGDSEGVELRARGLDDSSAEPSTLLQASCDDKGTAVARAARWKVIDDVDIGELADSGFGEPDDSLLRCGSLPQSVPTAADGRVEEALVSHLLRTLCPCTAQPDWGSLLIEYEGQPIDKAGLLRYICTMRREVGFHENAVEKLFLAIQGRCQPNKLRVTGRFMRRGGIDINPTRMFGYDDVDAPTIRIPGQ